jgi:hypothetical protein
MEKDGDASEQPPTKLLSPNQITEIDNAFTKVFDAAQKQGILRDAKSYRSFDEIFEISMRLHNGEKVADDELYRPIGIGQSKPLEAIEPVVSKPAIGEERHVEIVERMDVEEYIPVQKSTAPAPMAQQDIVMERMTMRKVPSEATPKEVVVPDMNMAFSDEEPPPLPTTVPRRRNRPKPKSDDDSPTPKRRRSEGRKVLFNYILNCSIQTCTPTRTRKETTILGKPIYRFIISRTNP